MVDLGAVSGVSARVLGVDRTGNVLIADGGTTKVIRANGTTLVAPVPLGHSPPFLNAISAAGLVVGRAAVGSGGDAYWWDTGTGQSWTASFVPPPGTTALGASLSAVDGTGEAGGFGTFRNPDTSVDFSPILSHSPGTTASSRAAPAGQAIIALQPGYEAVQYFNDRTNSAGTGFSIVNRTTNTETPLTVVPRGQYQSALAPDGTLVGGHGSPSVPALERPSGVVQDLQNPTPFSSVAAAIDPAGTIVGSVGAVARAHAVLWPDAASAPVDLTTLLPPDSGWLLNSADAISPNGELVAGVGQLNGQAHVYLGRLAPCGSGMATDKLRLTGGASALGADCLPSIDWTMPNHLSPGRASGWRNLPYGLPRSDYLYPHSWTAKAFLTSGAKRYTCAPGFRWVWSVVKLPAGARLTKPLKPGCSTTLAVSRLGHYPLLAKEQRRVSGKWRDTGAEVKHTIRVKDVLLVGLGDSNGSGEGNPPFFFPRCNRSEASYQFRTAMYVEKQDPRSSVSFLFASCSGARIEHLYSRTYRGIRPGAPLPPQLKQVAARLRNHGAHPVRKVDGVLMSIGVNNLTFGQLMFLCVVAATGNHACPNTPARPLDLYQGYPGSYQLYLRGGFPDIGAVLARLQSRLLSRYGPLSAALRQPISRRGLGVRASHVFVAQYPDFTHDDAGHICGPTGFARFSPATWSWLSANAAILNHTVRRASTAAGWSAVPSSPDFLHHGYCAKDSYFVGIYNAHRQDDDAGPFHPDRLGHGLEAGETDFLVCPRLLGTLDCTSKP